MKNKENASSQKARLILLMVMSAVIFGTAAMIITALLTLSDLRNDMKQMNDQMIQFQADLISNRSN